MKVVRSKHRKLIEDLVNSTDTISDVLDRNEIPRTSFYRWLKDPVFLEAYQEAKSDFEASLRGKFVSKRRRIEELEKLYDDTPLTAEERWHNGELKRTWLNVPEKRALLKQIKEELEGLDVRIGETGAADDVDIRERRRVAAAELEAFEAEEGE